MARIEGLDHIGVAVDEVDRVADLLCRVLGAERQETIELDSEDLRIVSVHAGDTHLELFEPRGGGSVRRFIDKRGNAMHHVCLRVDDLDGKLRQLRADGVRIIDETPRTGAFGQRVAFIHPSETGGILIELSQTSR